jgi:hypothetical protein
MKHGVGNSQATDLGNPDRQNRPRPNFSVMHDGKPFAVAKIATRFHGEEGGGSFSDTKQSARVALRTASWSKI